MNRILLFNIKIIVKYKQSPHESIRHNAIYFILILKSFKLLSFLINTGNIFYISGTLIDAGYFCPIESLFIHACYANIKTLKHYPVI